MLASYHLIIIDASHKYKFSIFNIRGMDNARARGHIIITKYFSCCTNNYANTVVKQQKLSMHEKSFAVHWILS